MEAGLEQRSTVAAVSFNLRTSGIAASAQETTTPVAPNTCGDRTEGHFYPIN